MNATTLRKALRADIRSLRMSQKDFTDALGISQQALAGWFKRGNVPEERREDVKKILGPDSQVARFMGIGFLKDSTATMEPQVPNIEHRTLDDFRAAIEADIPGARLYALAPIGAQSIALDYVSPRFAVEVKAVPDATALARHVTRSILLLALARFHAVAPRAVLIVVRPSALADDPTVARTLERITWEAQPFNVEVFVVSSFHDAGRLVVQLEMGDA